MPILKWESWVSIDGESGCRFGEENIIEIATPQALVQAIGYAKRALSNQYSVYFRGQTACYRSMIPYLFRSIKTARNDKQDWLLNKKIMDLKTFVNSIIKDEKFMRGVSPHATEGVLQHYGIPTRYLDLVDNIWVALWFSSHKRYQANGINIEQYRKSGNNFSYIYIMRFGEVAKQIERGVYITTDGFEIIDLRTAVDSGFLRPHAQHGIVVRKLGPIGKDSIDLHEHVEVILKIKTEDALDWLGSSILSDQSYMFPSPFFDIGYRSLRKKIQAASIGNIDTIW